mmetsp:Transcript_29986/g.59324  ORF Transcript_29986/g.59324 Transcript_29986/m.59324 type:complete len:91 (+) Transcript_29986:431-703(+)
MTLLAKSCREFLAVSISSTDTASAGKERATTRVQHTSLGDKDTAVPTQGKQNKKTADAKNPPEQSYAPQAHLKSFSAQTGAHCLALPVRT